VDVATKTLSVFKFDPDSSSAKLISVAEIELKQTQNLLDFLNAHNIGISQSCGGFATCTTCRIIVTKGSECLAPRQELEAERALERNFSANERLACQVEIPAQPSMNIEIIIANPIEE
jgi:ferredoxin